jgi:hypothetical protein
MYYEKIGFMFFPSVTAGFLRREGARREGAGGAGSGVLAGG